MTGSTSTMPRAVSAVVVDDHALVRSGIIGILEAGDVDVVGEAADGAEAVELVRRCTPDVVVMDIRMPGMDGIEATRRITRQPAAPQVLILTTFDLDEYVYRALQAGAAGFLLKDAPPAQLLEGVRSVASGDALLAPALTRRLIEQYVTRPAPALSGQDPATGLSSREREVWLMLARGRSNAEIAAALFLSEATVKAHVGRLFTKLGLRDRVQAVVLAYETGLVQPGASA